jgi:DNA repair/transcription protein MET18/MMS19
MQDILLKWQQKQLTVAEAGEELEKELSQKNLLEFIKYHTTLTSEDPYKRLDALELLNLVLKKISISQSQSVHLLQFYVSKLDDQLSVDQVLKGIYSLLNTSTVSRTDQLKIPLGIFTELDVQAFPQNTRYTCFQIFEYLLLNNTVGLQKISKDFISGFVTTMDGEKDPRNLLLLFKIVKLITIELDISSNISDLFEVVFCYFPITFRPPPDDVYLITSDDLKTALREAIISSHLYAIHAIPVLLEKLASSSNSAKRDSMDTISASLPTYTANPYLPHLTDLWKGAKNEIAQALDEANELSALKMIRELSKHLPAAISISGESKTALERWVDLFLPECLENLQHPEQKYAKACGKILMSAASAGKPAATLIISKTLPVLLKQLTEEETPSKKQVLLQVINDLIMASRLVYGTRIQNDSDEEMANSPLADFQGGLVEVYATIVSMDLGALKLTAIRGVYELISSQGLLSTQDQTMLLSHLNALVISDNDEFVLESSAQLEKLAKEQPLLIKSTSLQLFFTAGISEPSLKAISTICVEETVFEEASARFFGMMSASSDPLTLRAIVKTLLDCLQRQASKKVVLAKQISHVSNLIRTPEVYEVVVNSCYLDFVKILNMILQSLTEDQQSSFFKSSFQMEYFQKIDTFERLVFYQACICNARPKVMA